MAAVALHYIVRLCFVFVLFVLVQGPRPKSPVRQQICKTYECERRNQDYLANMDHTVNPCTDFFKYACGNWAKENPGPKYAGKWGVTNLLQRRTLHKLRDIMEKSSLRTNRNYIHAKMVFNTCTKILSFARQDAKDLAAKILKIGRYRVARFWDIHNRYLQLTGESPFFDYYVQGFKKFYGIPIIHFAEPSSAYGSIFHDNNWKPEEEEAYKEFLFTILKKVNLMEHEGNLERRIDDVIQFRKALTAMVSKNKAVGPDQKVLPKTASGLHMWAKEGISSPFVIIPFEDIIKILFYSLPRSIRDVRELYILRRKQYFVDLVQLLTTTSAEVLITHMETFFVERHLLYTPELYKLLEKTSVEPYSHITYIREDYYERWELCLQNMNMQDTLGKLLVAKWLPSEHVKISRALIENVRTAMKKDVAESTWVDHSTQGKIKRRIDGIDEWIGYPPWYTNASIPEESGDYEPISPNATLDPEDNVLYIHAPLLKSPFFHKDVPAVFNYGGIGAMVGHEFYHIIDDCGIYMKGKNVVKWWSDEMRTKCVAKKFCYIEEYNKITELDFKLRYGIKIRAETSYSVLENFPDAMGLSTAYRAYQESLSRNANDCQVLSSFKDFTCDQLFFIAFANTFCGTIKKKLAIEELDTAVHSVSSVRVNGAVSQNEIFGATFGCFPGMPMNPRKKCNLWK